MTLGTDLDWTACVRALAQVSPRLGAWATAAACRTHETLAAIGADALPGMVVHGDFAPWNVHYRHGAGWRDRPRPDAPGQPGPTSWRSRAPGGHRQRSTPTAASWPGWAGRSASLKKRRFSRSITPSGSTRSPGRSPAACGRASSTWPWSSASYPGPEPARRDRLWPPQCAGEAHRVVAVAAGPLPTVIVPMALMQPELVSRMLP